MTREKIALPLVRDRGGKAGTLPDAEAITQAMQLSTTAEAATYLYEEFEQLIAKAKLLTQEAVIRVKDILKIHADNVGLAAQDNGNVWAGKPPSTNFKKFQDELVKDASKFINEQAAKDINLDFAVSNNSELLRGYSSNNEPLDPKTVDAMDSLFNAWLAEKMMICKDGVIYEGVYDKEGQLKIKQDASDNPGSEGVRANAVNLRQMITSADGFQQYVHQHNKSAKIVIQERDYPGQAAVVDDEAGLTSGGGAGGGR